MKDNGEWELFSYKHVTDDAFAPNPYADKFGEVPADEMVLKGCKEYIERNAQPGDWIVGIAPGKPGKISYAMEVTRREPNGKRGVYSARGHYWYFGENLVTLPSKVWHIGDVRRHYYSNENDPYKEAFVEWRRNDRLYPPGVYGRPRHWMGSVPDGCQHELNSKAKRRTM